MRNDLRERKFDFLALFLTLSLGFTAGSDRSLQAFVEHYVEIADCEFLSYASFYGWFSPVSVALRREILDNTIEDLDLRRNDLRGRLEHFRDILIIDATFVSVYQDDKDVYRATGDDQVGLKLHLTESLSAGLPTRFRTTD